MPDTSAPATTAERPKLRALIVEDSEFDALILVNHLRQGGWKVESKRVADAGAFEHELRSGGWDLVLCCNRVQIAFGEPGEVLTGEVIERTYGGAIVTLGGEKAILPPHHHDHGGEHP